jgi:hypothetical protein
MKFLALNAPAAVPGGVSHINPAPGTAQGAWTL